MGACVTGGNGSIAFEVEEYIIEPATVDIGGKGGVVGVDEDDTFNDCCDFCSVGICEIDSTINICVEVGVEAPFVERKVEPCPGLVPLSAPHRTSACSGLCVRLNSGLSKYTSSGCPRTLRSLNQHARVDKDRSLNPMSLLPLEVTAQLAMYG